MSSAVLISGSVTPPAVSAAVEAHALAMVRGKALEQNTDRLLMLRTAAREVEVFCGRLLWPADGGGARRSVTEVEVMRGGESGYYGGSYYGSAYAYGARGRGGPVLLACPQFPDVSGVTVSVVSVQVWDDETSAYVDPTPAHRVMPAGRIEVAEAGIYQVTADLTPSATVPDEAVEAVCRLWAFRAQLRPGDLTMGDGSGEQQVLAGAIMKSGAAEIMRTLRNRVSV